MMLAVGQTAPNVNLYTSDGTSVTLNKYWTSRPLILAFLRHYGCQFCRQWITTLRGAYPDIVGHNVAVVAVAQGSPAQAAHFTNTFRVPFPVLSDSSRESFRAFGLMDGSVQQTIGPKVMLQMASAAVAGTLPGLNGHVRALTGADGSSLKQLSGTFVISMDGTLRYAHVASPIYSHPSLDELYAALDH
jgi:peroxiredoxin